MIGKAVLCEQRVVCLQLTKIESNAVENKFHPLVCREAGRGQKRGRTLTFNVLMKVVSVPVWMTVTRA